MNIPTIELNNKSKMPQIGFGTWRLTPGKETKESVLDALEVGYRLVDTARAYDNEKSVGEAIKESKIPREEIFLTTKLWNNDQGYKSALKAFDESLQKLGTDYLDLYLIHWPETGTRKDSWRALQEIHAAGKAKAIGVSNYTIRHLEELLSDTKIVPAVNQVEFHPFLYEEQKELLAYCKDKGIILEAYCPLARARHMENSVLHALSQRHAKTPAQIMLRWCIQKGTVPIPKSAHLERIKENIKVFDFELSDEEMKTIDSLSNGDRVTMNPNEMA